MPRPILHSCLLACMLAMLALFPAAAHADRDMEPQVKAAFIFNFTKFVEWPENSFKDPGDALKICVQGSGTVFKAMEGLGGKEAGGRTIAVSRRGENQPPKPCQILFLADVEDEAMRQSLAECSGKPVLTVSDIEGFEAKGGIITLVRRESKIGFIVNLAAAEKAGLKISSQLLKLAESIRR